MQRILEAQDGGLRGLLSQTKYDLPSGLVVFLVALPLCLGIALASGAPLFAGIITGIVGGIVVGTLSGSQLSVSGPAAGLTVIVLGAITSLGSYEAFLTAVVLAGLMQLALGYVKAGIIGLYFPSSVIKGMLAAIGLILILKQLPHFLGIHSEAMGVFEFNENGGMNTFSQLGYALSHINPGALTVGLISLAILVLWERPALQRLSFFKLFPGALAAVIFSIVFVLLAPSLVPSLTIAPAQFVSLPNLFDAEVRAESFRFPMLAALANPQVWVVAATIAIIASLETLLCLEAVDKLDSLKRRSPNNRELKAQGVGNLVCGLIGGIPLTSVIVRSSANVNAGGRTKMSAIWHGVFLLASAVAIPGILNLIPLSALAAVLLVVGYKLTKPALIKKMWSLGHAQFVPFAVTIVAILFTDLLVGIIIGMNVGIFYILRANYKTPYYYHDELHPGNGRKQIVIKLSEHVSFLNKASLQLTLEHLPRNAIVTLDGSLSTDIDYDCLEIIHNFAKTASSRGIDLELISIPDINDNRSTIKSSHAA